MDHGEQDHTRCEELRQNDRDIRFQRAELVADDRQERSMLSQLQSEYAELHSNLMAFQASQEAAKIASNTPGRVGVFIVGTGLAAAIEIANVEAKIGDVKIRIEVSVAVLEQIQNNHDRLNRIQAENAARMKNLNCALPS